MVFKGFNTQRKEQKIAGVASHIPQDLVHLVYARYKKIEPSKLKKQQQQEQ